MYKGIVTYKEKDIQKLEVKHADIFVLMEMIGKFYDLEIVEVHIYKEA